ncbi:hypothetical protein CDD83_6605 [Cordyceps sp. RAO-2017]|nr:hypothetical protein CDD83_6605 [Cordyceps sp. RAO-2017]
MGALFHYNVAVAALLSAVFLGLCVFKPLYNVFFHPLRTYPGPLICKLSALPRHAQLVRGRLPAFVADLHDAYGPVVRVGPNELSFIDSQAWRDIYSPLNDKLSTVPAKELEKDSRFYSIFGPDVPDNLMIAKFEEHQQLRRRLAPGFTEKALRAQEPIIQHYVNMLVERLRALSADGSAPVNLTDWFTYLTFDIIGKMAFGSDFGCVEKSQFHPWVEAITKNLREFVWLQLMAYFDTRWLSRRVASFAVLGGRAFHENLTKQMLQSRLDIKEDRADIIGAILKSDEPFTFDKLHSNSSMFIIAGSETTATLLTGFFSLLSENPKARGRVTNEIRSSFRAQDDITLASVKSLPYLLACINEALRLLPPTPNGMARVVPKAGRVICGQHVPQDTIVSVAPWAAYRSEQNFALPQEFHPERFLKDDRFANDNFNALQPFSFGHRNCIGRHLAYAEAQLVLAKIIFNFDFEVDPGNKEWISQQKAYVLWDRSELKVIFRPVR